MVGKAIGGRCRLLSFNLLFDFGQAMGLLHLLFFLARGKRTLEPVGCATWPQNQSADMRIPGRHVEEPKDRDV